MVDWFLILIVLIMLVLLGVINLYIMAHYSHPLESKFGGSIFAKVIIILALMMAQGQILLLPLDVSDVQNDAGLDMKSFWYTLTMTSAIFIFFILPVAMFYYETEGDELKSRVWHAVMMEFFFIVISCLIVFVTYATLSNADIPLYKHGCDMSISVDNAQLVSLDSTSLSTDCSGSSSEFTVTVSFAVYLIGLIAFIGWFVFLIFVGVGFSAIPIDLINEFRGRPRSMDKGEFNRRRNTLLQHVQKLRKDGKVLENVKESVDKKKGLDGWKKRRFFNRDLTKYEARCLIAEREFVTLEKISNLSKVEPFLYWFKLLAGIVLAILSFFWIIHILLWVLIEVNGKPVHPFFNNFLDGLVSGKVEFMSTGVFTCIALYLLWAAMKGNMKFGLRFFCFTFYPMRANETFLSSFIFNAFMISIWTMSLVQFLVTCFSQYCRDTDAYLIFLVQINNMWFFQWFWSSQFFPWLLLIWIIISFFYLIFKPQEKLSLDDQIKDKDLEANRH